MVILIIFHYLPLSGKKGLFKIDISNCSDSSGAKTCLKTIFVTLDPIVHKLWLSPPILPIFTSYGEERVVKT